MECSRCPIQPLIHAFTKVSLDSQDASLGRMKTKSVISAIRDMQDSFSNICKACVNAQPKVSAAFKRLQKAAETPMQKLASAVSDQHDQIASSVSELQSAFQKICLACSASSNDDNPSNHGQYFVSLDSGNCQAHSGKAGSTATDDNIAQARADWISMHAAPESKYAEIVSSSSFSTSNDEHIKDTSRINAIPEEVEDILRKEFANFVSLDIFDKMLVCCLISGMNIAEFARMLWLPYSIVNPKTKTIKSITKQAAHARWSNIVAKFPIFANIATSSRSKTSNHMKPISKAQLYNPNADLPDSQFENGKKKRKKKIKHLTSQFTSQSLSSKALKNLAPRSSRKDIQPLLPSFT